MITAMVKAVLLDVDLAVTTYFDKMTEEAAERDRKGKAEIERTVSLTGDALQRLAPGNLTTRLTDAFTPEFDQIKTDTDLVFDHLEQLVRRLRAASRSLKTATGEILSGANDLADRTTRQAATIEETSAAMEQLMETVADNARRAERASNMAASASALASDGGKVMGEANAAMERIAVSSDQIRNIIGMIDDIALSNQSAGAERFGGSSTRGRGRQGFAVVAIEVRRLAQNAAQASNDVKELIDRSADEVRDGAQLVADAAKKT